MSMTELVYSSHDRCEYLHREWIVERALRSWDNKTILYLPFSSGARPDQEYSWGTFAPYLDRFRCWGLDPRTFFWTEGLGREDAQLFFDWLSGSEVVILGGGRTTTGLDRYRAIGRAFGNPDAFVETLWDRQRRGKLTVGFSAGADQLCEWSCDDPSLRCFGLVPRVVVQLHFERGAEGRIQELAWAHPDCLVFGLPNDSGVAAVQGTTRAGRPFQVLQVVTDNSWDRPEDHWHIKTRQGVKVEHRYADGRDWKFNGGDEILRVFHQDGGSEVWIKRPELPNYVDYWTQEPTWYTSAGQILDER